LLAILKRLVFIPRKRGKNRRLMCDLFCSLEGAEQIHIRKPFAQVTSASKLLCVVSRPDEIASSAPNGKNTSQPLHGRRCESSITESSTRTAVSAAQHARSHVPTPARAFGDDPFAFLLADLTEQLCAAADKVVELNQTGLAHGGMANGRFRQAASRVS
jgi:hypothetical protein